MTQAMSMIFGDQTGGESSKVRNLRRIDSSGYNRDFVNNIAGLNSATDYMAQYLIVMQKGIDEANKNIIQKIQDFIADLIIIFTGGSDTGFEFGDLGYIVQAIGALFGFQGLSGPVNLLEAAGHFLGNFLEPLNAFGNAINGFISTAIHFLASLLDMVPIVGGTLSESLENIADGLNGTHSTANTAQSTATTAQSTATAAQSIANAASTVATAAQIDASNAANEAAAAQQTADIAYSYGTYREKEFAVNSAGLNLGNNETVLGITLAVPPGSRIILTRLVYSMKVNTGTVTVQLIRRALNGNETVVHTTTISSAAITFPDNTIDYEIQDLDHYFCNITAISGIVTALHCLVEYVIIEDAP